MFSAVVFSHLIIIVILFYFYSGRDGECVSETGVEEGPEMTGEKNMSQYKVRITALDAAQHNYSLTDTHTRFS